MLRSFAIIAALWSVGANAQDDLAAKIVNVPAEVMIYGGSAKVMKDPKVQGGHFYRIESPGKPNAWDIGVNNSIKSAVKAGDRLVLAFWARSHKSADGSPNITLPFNAIQLSGEPYTPVFSGPVTLGPEWKLHRVDGKSDKDYPAGGLGVGMHLSAAKQTVDLGPVIVLNLGQ